MNKGGVEEEKGSSINHVSGIVRAETFGIGTSIPKKSKKSLGKDEEFIDYKYVVEDGK